MKNLITIMILFVAFGCGKSEVEKVEAGSKTLEASVVGIYSAVNNIGETIKFVMLENGFVEVYQNGKQVDVGKWKIVGNEVHVVDNGSVDNITEVHKIEANGDLIMISHIKGGKRAEIPKEDQHTWKKLK